MDSIYLWDSRKAVAQEDNVGRGILSKPENWIWGNYKETSKDGTINWGPRIKFVAMTFMGSRSSELSRKNESFIFQ